MGEGRVRGWRGGAAAEGGHTGWRMRRARARQQALMAGLTSVYTYGDKGCDCATENAPVEQILPGWQQLHAVNKCSEDCCGDEGILLKKYERTLNVAFDANTEHSQRLDVGD